MPVPDWAQSGLPLIAFLFVVVFCRAQATYWLGRLAVAGALSGHGHGGLRGRIAQWFMGPTPQRGAALLQRWGLIIIPLCFLTVGIQTAINAGAGIVRLKWRVYTLAMIPGCVAWALLYGLGLLAVWIAAAGAIAGNPWAWLVLGLLIGIIVGTMRWRQMRSRAKLAAVPLASDAQDSVTAS